MPANYEVKEGVGIVRVTGPLLSGQADEFRQAFTTWLAGAGCRHVIADLAAMDQLDSAGLGALVAAMKKVMENGGDLKIAALQKRPRLVFEITRSHRVFEIFDTVEEALRATR